MKDRESTMLSDLYSTRISSKSIFILEHKIKSYFNEVLNEQVAIFCDNCDLNWPSENEINIVLFGNALNDINYIRNFPRTKKYKLWVLCDDFKRRLNKYYQIPKNHIGVIDRYMLFPRKQAQKQIANPLEPSLSYIYSARPSTLKNFRFTVKFLEIVAKNLNTIINIEILCPNFKKSDFDRHTQDIQNINFTYRGDLGMNWINEITHISKKVLLQFSLDPKDDFNVSTAQWQQKGGCVLTSNIGPYLDLKSPGVFHLNSEFIISSIESNYDPNILSQAILSIKKYNRKEQSFIAPVAISYQALENCIRKTPINLKNKIATLNTHQLHDFCKEVLSYE